MLTGHSLGGGIALVVGALTDRLAVALQPPGRGDLQMQERLSCPGNAIYNFRDLKST